MSQSNSISTALGLTQNRVDAVIKGLAAHPYLWAFAACLFLHPFYLGSESNVPENALLIETLLVLAAGLWVIYRFYKNNFFTKGKAVLIVILFLTADLIALKYYSKQSTKGLWMLFFGTAIIFLLYYFSQTKKHTQQLNALLILACSFVFKFYYVYYTSVYTRQNDVHEFGGDNGHAAYIEYILYNHRLPDFDVRSVWQFCHPPLHHIICAAWIELNENILGIGHNAARESLQTLTLFYSMAITITAYRIFKHFKLKGAALYVPMLIVCFHPAFILLSGSINNDVLSVAFMMGAILCTLKWYKNQTLVGILKIALCVGLGMMTKLSAALAAPPIAVVFLVVFIKKIRTDGKRLFGQFAAFAVVCVPLGLWFEIKNYIKFKVPITYVQEMDNTVTQYIGNQSFLSRITDFSSKQFKSVFEQWAYYDESGSLVGYNEYNPLVALLKNSLFGESINDDFFAGRNDVLLAARVFFWLAAALAGACLIMLIVNLFLKCGLDGVEKALFGTFYAVMMLNFYKMSYDYPFTCTMNFRYITPTVIIGALFCGVTINRLQSSKNNACQTLSRALTVTAFTFVLLSVIIYIYI